MRKPWLGVAAVVGLALAAIAWRFAFAPGAKLPGGSTATADPVATFIERHWPDPLPPQGEPPAALSALEASLGAQACGQCHARQHADWNSSLHSRAMGPGIAWQLHSMSQGGANRCMRCHAPLAEQQALVALERKWEHAPSAAVPAYVAPDLHRQGVVCAACHVRRHVRAGPPRSVRADPAPREVAAHGGFVAEPGFGDSRFCAVCHQFAPDGAQLNGKLLENTYEEWRASPAARAGLSCQGCHMPERRHLWRGIHDADMVRSGLSVSLQVQRGVGQELRARAVLANVGAGHRLPTYVVAQIVATLELVDAGGSAVAQLGQHTVGRMADLELTQELFDTRIAQGESVALERVFNHPGQDGWAVRLIVDVHPARHYEALFRQVRARRGALPEPAVALLDQALRQAANSRYELYRLSEALPAR